MFIKKKCFSKIKSSLSYFGISLYDDSILDDELCFNYLSSSIGPLKIQNIEDVYIITLADYYPKDGVIVNSRLINPIFDKTISIIQQDMQIFNAVLGNIWFSHTNTVSPIQLLKILCVSPLLKVSARTKVNQPEFDVHFSLYETVYSLDIGNKQKISKSDYYFGYKDFKLLKEYGDYQQLTHDIIEGYGLSDEFNIDFSRLGELKIMELY